MESWFKKNIFKKTGIDAYHYPDLSNISDDIKQQYVNDMVKVAAHTLLYTYKSLGLKTHITSAACDEITGEFFEITFKKVDMQNLSPELKEWLTKNKNHEK